MQRPLTAGSVISIRVLQDREAHRPKPKPVPREWLDFNAVAFEVLVPEDVGRPKSPTAAMLMNNQWGTAASGKPRCSYGEGFWRCSNAVSKNSANGTCHTHRPAAVAERERRRARNRGHASQVERESRELRAATSEQRRLDRREAGLRARDVTGYQRLVDAQLAYARAIVEWGIAS